MKSNSLALVITLALNAGVEEAQNAINEIERIFGISNTGTVAPESLVASATQNAAPANLNTDVVGDAAADTSTNEVDGTGLPWDERIHSSSKEKNKDGTWRSKRNVDEAFKKKVEKQLRATMDTPPTTTPAATTPAPAPAPAPTLPPPPAPGLPPLPGANVVNPAYASLVKLVAENTKSDANPAGRITDEWLTQVAIPHYTQLAAGTSLQDLAHRADLCAALEAGLRLSLGM